MKAALLVMFSLIASNGAFAKEYTTPFPAGAANGPLVINTGPPDKKLAGASMALVPNTSFIIIQTKGGILLLGPLIGAANIEAKTRALAKNSAGGYMSVDLPSIAALSLALIGADTQPKPQAFTISPYAYVQQCGDDEQYRVAVALDVSGPPGRNAWHGRYVAHLPSSIPYAQFLQPSTAQVAAFTAELTAATDAATRLLERDMRGELSAPGRTVTFGSLNLIGNKIGGAGVYTLAKDMAWNNVRLIEERDGNVVVRPKDSPSTLLYGMHIMARRQVHTLHD
jgi:hypothetical protein